MIPIEVGLSFAVFTIGLLITIQVILRELYRREHGNIPRWWCAAFSQVRWIIVAILALDLAAILPIQFAVPAVAMGMMVFVQSILLRRREDVELLDSLTASIVASEGSVPDAFERFSEDRGNSISRRCRDFAHQLRCGIRPAFAARASRLPLSVNSLLLLEDGKVRTTPHSNSRLSDSEDTYSTWTSWPLSTQLIYLASLILVIFMVPLIVNYSVSMPLWQLADEFGMPDLPFTRFSKFINGAQFYHLTVLATLLVTMFWVLVLVCWVYPARWLVRITPWFGNWVRQSGKYDALKSLAAGLRSGRSTVDSAMATANLTQLRWTEMRAGSTLKRLRAGQSFAVATRSSGLVSAAEAKWIATAEATGNLVPTLESIADSGWRRFELMWRIRLSWLIPATVLAAGFGVMLMVYMVFGSLAQFIGGLT